jgi:hypothetical protein
MSWLIVICVIIIFIAVAVIFIPKLIKEYLKAKREIDNSIKGIKPLE